ncbi:MAG: ATP-binding protein [Deltaproteobacteria bacterium]|nr:ATP-binding protein [Deltaproteobacteria bacterium]
MKRRTGKTGSADRLRYRLPNSPVTFVGRGREVEELAGAIAGSPLTVVWGLGGFGKTSLVLKALERRASRAASVMVRVVSTASPVSIVAEVLRGVCLVARVEARPWTAVGSDFGEAIAVAIDLVEETRAVVVLDDIHKMGFERATTFLETIAAHARSGKWIATSRERFSSNVLRGHLYSLPAMSANDLERLALSLLPAASHDLVRDAVRAATGSPWRLLQIIESGGAAIDRPAALWERRVRGVEKLLETLAISEISLPPELLKRLGVIRNVRDAERLERLGIIESGPTGLRLHDVARPYIREAPSFDLDGSAARHLATCLANESETAVALEGLRLLLVQERSEEAASLLEARSKGWLENGYATVLWHLLRTASDDSLRVHQLRAAVEAIDPTVVEILPEPTRDDYEARLFWAKALSLKSRAELVDYATRLAKEAGAAGRQEIAFDAALIAAIGVRFSDPTASERILLALRPKTVTQSARRAAGLILLWTQFEKRKRALEYVRKTVPLLRNLDAPTRLEVVRRVLSAFTHFGLIKEATEFSERWFPPSGPAFALEDLRASVMRFSLLVNGGRFDEAVAMRSWLAPRSARSTVLAVSCSLHDVPLRIARGELKDVDDLIDRSLALCDSLGPSGADARDWFLAYRVEVAILLARGVGPSDGQMAALAAPSMNGATHLRLVRQLQAARAGQSLDAKRAKIDGLEVYEDEKCWSQITDAYEALLAGRAERARVAARRAVAATEALGLGNVELEARAACCDVHLALGDLRAVGDQSRMLARRAREMGAPRFVAEAEFYEMAGARDPVRLATLMKLAPLDVAPTAARRCRRVLGVGGSCDRVDEAVLAAMAARVVGLRIVRLPTRADGVPDQCDWGLDNVRREVALPGGRVVNLWDREILWRVLAAIANAGGEIDQEALFADVWQIAEFHPIRHGKRIHTTIHYLRAVIEDDPDRPTRLVTTDTGYAFGRAATVWLRL